MAVIKQAKNFIYALLPCCYLIGTFAEGSNPENIKIINRISSFVFNEKITVPEPTIEWSTFNTGQVIYEDKSGKIGVLLSEDLGYNQESKKSEVISWANERYKAFVFRLIMVADIRYLVESGELPSKYLTYKDGFFNLDKSTVAVSRSYTHQVFVGDVDIRARKTTFGEFVLFTSWENNKRCIIRKSSKDAAFTQSDLFKIAEDLDSKDFTEFLLNSLGIDLVACFYHGPSKRLREDASPA